VALHPPPCIAAFAVCCQLAAIVRRPGALGGVAGPPCWPWLLVVARLSAKVAVIVAGEVAKVAGIGVRFCAKVATKVASVCGKVATKVARLTPKS